MDWQLQPASVLIASPDWRSREALVNVLDRSPLLEVAGVAEHAEDALSMLSTLDPTAVLVAGRSPLANAFALIKALLRHRPDIPIVLLAEQPTEGEVFEALSQNLRGVLEEEAATPEAICHAVQVAVSGGFVALGGIVHDLLLRLVRQGSGAPAARYQLSPRQLEVLALLADGKTNREIGQALGISEQGAKNHVGRILRKLDVPNRTTAATLAREEHLTRTPVRERGLSGS